MDSSTNRGGSRALLAAIVILAWTAGESRAQDAYWDIVRDGQEARSTTARGAQAQSTLQNTEAAYRYIQDQIRQGRSPDLASVQELNRMLRDGQGRWNGQQGGGVWRTRGVGNADGANFTYFNRNGASVEQQQLLARYLESVSRQNLGRRAAVTAAADIHHFIVRNHMFGDGNGRTARAIADWVLMKNGLPPAHHAGVRGLNYDRLNLNDPPEVTRAQTRRYFAAATRAAEERLRSQGVPPPRAPGSSPGSTPRAPGTQLAAAERGVTPRAGVPEAPPVVEGPVGSTGGRGTGGTPRTPGGGPQLLGLRAGSTVTRTGHTIALAGGLHLGGKVLETAFSEEGLTADNLRRTALSQRSGLQFAGGLAGYILAERVAANVLASAIPIPVVGRLVGRPLIQMALRSTAGVAGATALSHAATGDKLDPVDLVGGSVAAGVGMAVGQALIPIPGVGAVVGGIAGGLAWDFGSRYLKNRRPPNRLRGVSDLTVATSGPPPSGSP